MTKTEAEKTKQSNAATTLLPLAPRTLCFDKNEFMKKDFSVDNFVADCRRRVQLETLRQDLEIYFKLLKNAMIELINKDYADFVNLSTNLVGMDKAIGQLREPLKRIKADVSDMDATLRAKVCEVEAVLKHQQSLVEKRQLLGHMRGLLQAVEKIESIQRSEEANTGQVLERIAGEFNHLQHHAAYCKGLPVLKQIRQRVAEITSKLQVSLERELVQGMSEGNTKQVHRCLNSYALISKTHDAETLVRIHLVEPFMKQLMEDHHGNVNIIPLKNMFNRILELVPDHLKLLCDVTSGRKNKLGEQYRGIPGYDFVVNSAWPEIVSSLENYLPELFVSRDPDMFHKRYQICMDFLCNFERQCGSQASISRLRQSDPYNTLMTHWSLPVYFQIRFQEIGGRLETSLSKATDLNQNNDKFRLHSSLTLWQCIEKCWDENIFLPALLHRFWKLTLQLLSRYNVWVKEICDRQIASPNSSDTNTDSSNLSLDDMASLIVDISRINEDVCAFYEERIGPRATKHGLKDASLLKQALDEIVEILAHHRSNLIKHIITSLCSVSTPLLKQTQDVPRLYRKTNRPAPTEASTYITGVCKPAVAFYKTQSLYVSKDLLCDWLTEFSVTISDKYYTVVSDVLMSVKKMEESMMRLQKLRSGKFSSGNLASLASGSDSLSDDDKIRLQLYLDVASFGNQMSECGVMMKDVEKYDLLLKMVEAAKNKSAASS